MKKARLSLIAGAMLCLPAVSSANDFSTVTRVQYVLECMEAHPNMNVYESVHKCSCVADEIAKSFTQREFEDADTGFQMRNMPADRGAVFRDDADVVDSISKFERVHAEAYASCRIK